MTNQEKGKKLRSTATEAIYKKLDSEKQDQSLKQQTTSSFSVYEHNVLLFHPPPINFILLLLTFLQAITFILLNHTFLLHLSS